MTKLNNYDKTAFFDGINLMWNFSMQLTSCHWSPFVRNQPEQGRMLTIFVGAPIPPCCVPKLINNTLSIEIAVDSRPLPYLFSVFFIHTPKAINITEYNFGQFLWLDTGRCSITKLLEILFIAKSLKIRI
jgi:hypothetical protein